ncbi:hypothetical protein SAMD00019534_125850 [Acytostelium subglobosum LB1]|uniref:hypothetical protein n=1 Tax=Acytostelium subglobosum LB1 TaxID=1410327 RepID=UPI000644C20E|nr:hypothetical protein SAMD00019534_125850 [Acytostelium subglobosum LB1]GAM29409.1 hypothetical protein SAMD00019534_125850 [Acytostelium subglobosum LB1]|eukprot:XP_012747635.1 hypothetical protein SAMD00019534_125850 [Acytostelium subglobosum LB1]
MLFFKKRVDGQMHGSIPTSVTRLKLDSKCFHLLTSAAMEAVAAGSLTYLSLEHPGTEQQQPRR